MRRTLFPGQIGARRRATSPRPRLLLVAGALLAARLLAAQAPVPDSASLRTWRYGGALRAAESPVGSESERYLRALQLAGASPLYPWTIRELSLEEIERARPSRADPWGFGDAAPRPNTSPVHVSLIRPQLRTVLNSDAPYGFNDGPMWAGRGLTFAIDAGVAVRAGPLSVVIDPLYFSAQNRPFPLLANNVPGRQLANGQLPGAIDLPQRFGESRYARLDPGESSARVDLLGVTAGFSTASQWWGPAVTNPLILGNNAGGFPHAFVGTSRPAVIGIGRLHARVELGSLSQSSLSPIPADSGRRLMTGLVVSFSPRGIDGLELGGARFFHQRWPRGGPRLSDLKTPFSGFTSGSIDLSQKYDPSDPRYSPQNQLASVFGRWVFPASGFEAYAEYMRNDRNGDVRDLIGEPDHDASFTLGFQRAWQSSSSDRLVVLRGEVVNALISHLERVRDESWPYTHLPLAQGHTQRGQVLGSYFIEQGGGGAVLGLDLYHHAGRLGVEYMRIVRAKTFGEGATAEGWDVMHVGSVEVVTARRGWELFGRLASTWELNRNFAGDAGNVSLATGIRCSCR